MANIFSWTNSSESPMYQGFSLYLQSKKAQTNFSTVPMSTVCIYSSENEETILKTGGKSSTDGPSTPFTIVPVSNACVASLACCIAVHCSEIPPG